jgi:carbonic anhydrase/acetyltransferase-like protein (isoleucine patch superfamily)
MAPTPPHDVEALQQRIERLSAALGQAPRAPLADVPAPARSGVRGAAWAGAGLGLAVVAVGIATGSTALMVLGAVLAVLSGVLAVSGVGEALLSSVPAGLAPRDATQAHIGMGAEVADDAVIEPGATVEMGATVGAGAVVKRGAVVRMGASVHARAIIEPGAVVGWGADVHEGATVGENASVAAGATVKAGASVPSGMRLMPGATWGRGAGARAETAAPVAAPVDPREARIHAACERIEAELRQAPESVRAYLGASEQTVRALRTTCLGLLERERMLRAESSPESLAFLAQERAVLEGRIATAADPSVRGSLEQAVAALDEQGRQRGLLQQSAERLDAELTRLVWTLDGMGTQLVRLRTAGAEAASAPDQAVLQSMQQLHGEIDAITEALEHVARTDAQGAWRGEPLAEVEPGAPGQRAGTPTRERR